MSELDEAGVEAAAREMYERVKRVPTLTYDIAYPAEQQQFRQVARAMLTAYLATIPESPKGAEGLREAIKDAVDDVLQWRETARHTDDEDVLVGNWPERDYDDIADNVVAALAGGTGLNIAEFAAWLCDWQGFSIDDETAEERERWMWDADAMICEVLRRAALSAPPSRDPRLADENTRLRELVTLADKLYVSASEDAQKRSDKAYRDEFGCKGPSLAGFLPGGADRDYHYARHSLGECPLPSHERYNRLAPPQPGNAE